MGDEISLVKKVKEKLEDFLEKPFHCFWIWISMPIITIVMYIIPIYCCQQVYNKINNIVLGIVICVALITILLTGIVYLRARLEFARIMLEIWECEKKIEKEEEIKQLKDKLLKLENRISNIKYRISNFE